MGSGWLGLHESVLPLPTLFSCPCRVFRALPLNNWSHPCSWHTWLITQQPEPATLSRCH